MVVRETRHGPVVSDIPGVVPPERKRARRRNGQPGAGRRRGRRPAGPEPGCQRRRGRDAPRRCSPRRSRTCSSPTRPGSASSPPAACRSRRAGDGEWPQPGADGAHDWVGWASGDALPHVVAPASGPDRQHATSEPRRRISRSSSAATGFGDWRARRVRQLLGAGKRSAADFAAMQVRRHQQLRPGRCLPALLARPRRRRLGRTCRRAAGRLGRAHGGGPAAAGGLRRLDATASRPWRWRIAACRTPPPPPWLDFAAWLLSPQGAPWCGGDCATLAATRPWPRRCRRSRPGAERTPPAGAGATSMSPTFADPGVAAAAPATSRSPGDDSTHLRAAAVAPDIDRGARSRLSRRLRPGRPGPQPLRRRARPVRPPAQPPCRDMLQRWRDGGSVTLPAAGAWRLRDSDAASGVDVRDRARLTRPAASRTVDGWAMQ